MNPQTRIYTKS